MAKTSYKIDKVELNYSEVGKLLKGSEVNSMLSGIASNIASSCGDGYGSDARVGKTRIVAEVKAETFKAKLDNTKNNTILSRLR